MISLSWTQFKSIVTANNLTVYYTELGNGYDIFASSSNLILECHIGKSVPVNSEQIDFETNFKATANGIITPVLPANAATETTLQNVLNRLVTTTLQPERNSPGLVVRPITLELPTFSIAEFDIAVANNKSMLAIQNTGTSVVRVREIWIINDRNTSTNGVAGEFQVNRINSFTGGTSITPVTYDTNDILPVGITAATNAIVSGESSILRRGRWSTDEWGPGTLDVEGLDHGLQQIEPFWRQTPNGKAFTIRQNQGLHVKFATNSTNGSFTVRMIFTVE